MDLCLVVWLISGVMHDAYAYPSFQRLVPNGDTVPSPCNISQTWGGVGHLLSDGGATRNQFGLDFQHAGQEWTDALCGMDSDGDGKTNGEELGDPHCTWTPNTATIGETPITHPGICEPIDSVKCEANNAKFGPELECNSPKTKECDYLNAPDILQKDLLMKPLVVPEYPTSYYCMYVELPSDDDYHIVAANPVITNPEVVHHMMLFACDFPVEFDMGQVRQEMGNPYKCGLMPGPYCQEFLAGWTYGLDVACNNGAGIPMGGRRGPSLGVIEIHYNNPRKLPEEIDSSGFRILYTSQLRPNDAATFLFGQTYLEIPANSTDVSFSGICPSECTSEMFKEPVYITQIIQHMHYLGRKQQMSIVRNGRKVLDLAGGSYSYATPFFTNFDPPIQLLPGDDLVIKCTYDSSPDHTTYFGKQTSDEMCYGFIHYYPKQDFVSTFCLQWKSVQRCKKRLAKFGGMYEGCSWREFEDNFESMTSELLSEKGACGHYKAAGGYHVDGSRDRFQVCSDACIRASTALLEHPCLQGDFGELLIRNHFVENRMEIFRTCANKQHVSSGSRLRLGVIQGAIMYSLLTYILLCTI